MKNVYESAELSEIGRAEDGILGAKEPVSFESDTDRGLVMLQDDDE